MKVTITGYDAYDRVVKNSISGVGSANGIAEQMTLERGYTNAYGWKMYFHDNMVKANVKITSVRYSDGTIWRLK
ncbi:hypothetical protein [Paenibacillus apiarius]|uniref:hypothetical protein n=1 Tax=Paenibacillus apiarius TaxID=46240 RepID=UPI003B3B6035